MLTIILCTLIGAGILYLVTEIFEIFGDSSTISIIGAGLCIGALCGLFIALIIGTHTNKVEMRVEITNLKLVAINDKSEYNGSFFLGTGAFQGNMYYAFYYKESDGAIKFGKFEANAGIKIYEEERIDAVLEIKKITTMSYSTSWWGIGDNGDRGEIIKIIRIPKGTIKRNYQLDLQ